MRNIDTQDDSVGRKVRPPCPIAARSPLRAAQLVTVWAATLLGVATCGGDDEGTETTVLQADDGSATDVQADAPVAAEPSVEGGSDDAELPVIDRAAMPAPGRLEFDVEGSTYDIDISAHDCQVGPDVVFVGLSDESDVFISATSSGDGYAGQVQIGAPDSDRVYGSLAGLEGAFAVDGPMAVYEGRFGWATRENPGVSEDAGTGTIRLTCM